MLKPGLAQFGHCLETFGTTPGIPQELESTLKLQMTHVGVISLSSVPLRVVQCEQTTVWATLRIVFREELGLSLQGQVRFVLPVRYNMEPIVRDCSIGAFSGRRRGLGYSRWRR